MSQIKTKFIENSAVTTAKVAALAIDDTKLASNSVTTAKIAALAVDDTKLASNSVTTAKIAALAVDDTKLASNSVTTAKIAALAVDDTKLASNSVTTSKINALAVDDTKLASNSVTNAKIAANAVTGTKIRLDNNQALRALDSTSTADIDIIKLTTADDFEFGPAGVKPAADDVYGLGSATRRWANIYVSSINNSTGNTILDVENKVLYDDAGQTAFLFDQTNRFLYDENSTEAIEFTTVARALRDAANQVSIDWTAQTDVKIRADVANTTARKLKLYTSTNDFSVNVDAPAGLTADVTFRLPATNGTNGYVLTTNGSGVTSWSAASGGATNIKENLTLNGTDITNQYKDLANVARTDSIFLFVNGIFQREGTDYTVSYTGGAGGNTRITFAGDLATGGAAELVATDVLNLQYET